MRLIRRGPEPPLLLGFRKTPGARYDGLPSDAKLELRQALVREQRGLCCFCMQRVEPEVSPALRVKIAHWMPQTVDRARDLAWSNLLAACPGNPDAPYERQHCDARQRNAVLTVNPLEPSHIDGITYTTSGAIRSSRADLQADLEERLNLHDEALCKRRREAVIRMADALGRRGGDAFKRADLQRALARCDEPNARGYLLDFAGALAWWLRRRLGA
jgi:uncharacterized protein (TIGR02646 family)